PSFSIVQGPAHGSVSLQETGSFSYIPRVDFNGIDAFTFIANDGEADSNVATVTLQIQPVNDTPVAEDLTVVSDEDVEVHGALIARDFDGDTLTFAVVSGPAHGALVLHSDGQ